jgi:hypothetical protein
MFHRCSKEIEYDAANNEAYGCVWVVYEGVGNKLPKMKIQIAKRIELQNGDNPDFKPVFRKQLQYINTAIDDKKPFPKWS